MLVSRRMHLTGEWFKWLVITMMALLISMMLATNATGESPDAVDIPERLPAEVEQRARPMETEPQLSPAELAWQALQNLNEGNATLGLKQLRGLPLPPEIEVWRQCAISVVHLERLDLELAEESITLAAAIDSENPVVEYLKALLSLERAFESSQPKIRLAVFGPSTPDVERRLLEDVAMRHLLRSIALADRVDLSLPLLPASWEISGACMPVVPPTVEDLLVATGTDNFVGKAHNLLSDLYFTRGELRQAESHMDAAHATGIRILYGYGELGDAYAAQGLELDAIRAYTKAIKQGRGIAVPLEEIIRNLRRSLIH